MSGTILVVRGLLRRGVPRGLAIAMLADLVSWYAAYALVGATALAILWHRGELNPALLAVGSAFLLLATGVPLAILGLRGRERSLPRWVRRLPWANEAFAATADAQPGAIFGGTLRDRDAPTRDLRIDATTLGIMLLAIATPADAAVVRTSFVVASMVATLAWVPGGLGTFEGSCVAMLHVHGVSFEAALAATLLTRGFAQGTRASPRADAEWEDLVAIAERARARPGTRPNCSSGCRPCPTSPSAHLTLDALLPELLQRIRTLLAVDTATVLFAEDDGHSLRVKAVEGLPEATVRSWRGASLGSASCARSVPRLFVRASNTWAGLRVPPTFSGLR